MRRDSGVTWQGKSRPPPDSGFTDDRRRQGVTNEVRSRFRPVEWTGPGGHWEVAITLRAARGATPANEAPAAFDPQFEPPRSGGLRSKLGPV
jgi:hypothetical protein